MDTIAALIKSYQNTVTFKGLKEFIHTLDIESINYEDKLSEPLFDGDYGRTILTLEPFECVLIHWPAGVGSAVHHHEGLFGYVWVLEGDLENVFYDHIDGKLIERMATRYVRNGLIPEPDGVIHRLVNPTDKRAVTLHFYYPAIESFDGMRLFNLEEGSIGVLADDAKSASWSLKPGHFKEVQKNSFQYVSVGESNKGKTHLMMNVIPKPSAERIREMNDAYFSEQAHQYDFSDFNQPSRNLYTSQIDKLIARHFEQQKDVQDVLDIAVGTGRRATSIRDLSGKTYSIHGVDISEEMCRIASDRGIDVHHQDWVNCPDLSLDEVDAITFLYAFGHVADNHSRVLALRKVHRYLKKGGLFFMDLFSIDNSNEWGPRALERFKNGNLDKYGYEKGDVFYRKIGLNEIAFLHYFSKADVVKMLEENGFEVVNFYHIGYAKNPGEMVESERSGNMFVVAKRV